MSTLIPEAFLKETTGPSTSLRPGPTARRGVVKWRDLLFPLRLSMQRKATAFNLTSRAHDLKEESSLHHECTARDRRLLT
jgi:hypothetical protein